MSMMMMQKRFDNEQKERQYQKESELREREFQLCCEEMAIVCEEVCVQRQMMNVMLMTMLNKNGGRTTATHHPAQAWDKLLTNPCYYFVRSYSVFAYYNDINQYNLEIPPASLPMGPRPSPGITS